MKFFRSEGFGAGVVIYTALVALLTAYMAYLRWDSDCLNNLANLIEKPQKNVVLQSVQAQLRVGIPYTDQLLQNPKVSPSHGGEAPKMYYTEVVHNTVRLSGDDLDLLENHYAMCVYIDIVGKARLYVPNTEYPNLARSLTQGIPIQRHHIPAWPWEWWTISGIMWLIYGSSSGLYAIQKWNTNRIDLKAKAGKADPSDVLMRPVQ